MVFAVLLVPLMVAILDAVWKTSIVDASPWRFAVFLPVVYGLADLVEDVLLLIATSHVKFNPIESSEGPPNDPCRKMAVSGLGWLIGCQVATVIKYLALGASAAFVIIGGVKQVVEGAPVLSLIESSRATTTPSGSLSR